MKIGVIGCGKRMSGLVRELKAIVPELEFMIADPDSDYTDRWLETKDFDVESIPRFADADALLERADELGGVMIGTRCKDHTPMAIKVAAAGLPLYLEKPVSISFEQLNELAAAWRGREDQVVVSFPLRLTPVFRAALEIVESGRLGTINQITAVTNVTYGGVYFARWHRNYGDSGGLWLQKATHDLDYINVILSGARATTIAATRSNRIYSGDKPHDLDCKSCDEAETCVESHLAHAKRGNSGGMNWENMGRDDWNYLCPFSREIRCQDAGAAIVTYDNGAHVSYSQNFVNRAGAGRRGARITGHDATLDFDFNGQITVVDHHRSRVDKIEVKATGGHGGGDGVLLQQFADLVRDGKPSPTTLRDGLISAAMCLAARDSCDKGTFETIPQM